MTRKCFFLAQPGRDSQPSQTNVTARVLLQDLFAVSLVVPLMSNHLKALGTSHFLICLLMSAYAGPQLLSGPLVGSWSDIRGRRTALLFTLAVCSVCYFSTGVFTSLPILFLLRIVLGLLKHTQSLCQTLVVDVVPPDQQSTINSQLTSFSSMGFMVGPAIAGHLYEQKSGFSILCSIVAALFLLNAGIVYFSLPRSYTRQRKDEDSGTDDKVGLMPGWQELVKAVTELVNVDWMLYWDIFLQNCLAALAFANFFANGSLIMKDRYDVPASWIGYTISFQGLIFVVAGFLITRLNNFYTGDEACSKRILHGFVLLTLSFAFLGYAPNFGLFLFGLIPMSAAVMQLRLAGSDALIQRTQPDKRGALVGAGMSVVSIARLFAPLISGFIYDVVGVLGVFVSSTVIALGGTVISYFLLYRRNQQLKSR